MSNIESQRKLGLLPKGADQGWAALSALELSPGFPSQVPEVLRTEIGQSVVFETAPDVFSWIEFWSIGWKTGQDQIALGPLDVFLDRAAAMHCQTVPDDQQFARNLPAQVPQKLCGLLATDAAAIESKVKLPPGNASDDRELAPRVTENQLRTGR